MKEYIVMKIETQSWNDNKEKRQSVMEGLIESLKKDDYKNACRRIAILRKTKAISSDIAINLIDALIYRNVKIVFK